MAGHINYQLRKFDMRWIAKDKTCVFIGKRDTGKSTLVKDLLYYQRDIPQGIVISGTQAGVEDYEQIVPPLFVYGKYKKEIVGRLINSQNKKIKKRGKANLKPVFLVMDDCLHDDKWAKDEEMKYIFFNGRHVKTLFILTMQYPLGIGPNMRSNIDFIFILRDTIVKNRKIIYENYAGMFPSFDVFCSIMNQCTENYECLVIHNNSKSNRFEDQVFWYKADFHPEFHVGSKKFWKKHEKEYNSNYADEEDEQYVNLGKRRKPRIHVQKTY